MEGDFLLLKNESDIKYSFGPVLDVRCVKDKPTHIKVCSNQGTWVLAIIYSVSSQEVLQKQLSIQNISKVTRSF